MQVAIGRCGKIIFPKRPVNVEILTDSVDACCPVSGFLRCSMMGIIFLGVSENVMLWRY